MAARSRVERRQGRTAKRRAPPRRRVKTRAKRAETAHVLVEAALAAFAHEVRTPLTGILAISDLLAASDLGERERRWASTIKANAEHLSALATLFVDAARPDSGSPALREELFDVSELARAVADSLAGRATAKGLNWQVEIDDALVSPVIGDVVRLRAAIENLIDNAVKFTDKGGVGLKVSAERVANGKVGVVFSVSDSGIGLTLDEIKRLFRPFSQANVQIAAGYGGAGLGLSFVKRIARAMGGDVVVTRRSGGGTTFTLRVRLQGPPAPTAASPAGPGEVRPQSAGALALHVLGVDDNPFGRVVLNTILAELGHRAEFVGRGEDAVARVDQGGFDCVLMDMQLPGIGGIEAIERIRKLPTSSGRIAVIGVSSRVDDEAASRAAGADAYLVKPVTLRALATALLEATRRAAAAT